MQMFKCKLESMQKECDGWREEVEKLTPLKDEVEKLRAKVVSLHERTARQQAFPLSMAI